MFLFLLQMTDIRNTYDKIAMAKVNLVINGKKHVTEVDPYIPVLWVLQDHFGLTGTKSGRGMGQFGTCTFHPDGTAKIIAHISLN